MGRNFSGDSSAVFNQKIIFIYCPQHTKEFEQNIKEEYEECYLIWVNGGWPGNFPLNNGFSFNFITAQDGDFCYQCKKEGVNYVVKNKEWLLIS